MTHHPLRHGLWAVPTLLALAACGGTDSQDPARIVATADSFPVPWNAAAPLDVLANDSTDGGTLALVSVGSPEHGSAAIDGGKVVYTPAAGFFGSDQFTYSVTNGDSTVTSTVAVDVSATLALNGRAYDAPMPLSKIEAVVGGVTYTATADADGYYSLPLKTNAPGQFIALTATGVGAQAHVKLQSLVGEMRKVAAAATAEGKVPAAVVAGLNVTNLSTAQAALAIQANGGVAPTTEATLAAANAQVPPEQVLQMAAVIKLVVDSGVPLPAGVTDTNQLVLAAATYQSFAQAQVVSNAAALNAAQQSILSDTFFAVAPAPVEVAATRVIYNGIGCCTTMATAITMQPDGKATLVSSQYGNVAGTWSVSEGVTRFVAGSDVTGDAYTYANDRDEQYSVQDHLSTLEWRQVSGDAQHATVSSWTTGYSVYTPLNGAPARANENYGGASSAQIGRMDDVAALTVPSAAELSAQPIAGLPAVPSDTDGWLGFSQDVAVFNADGSGKLQRTGSAFTWTRSDTELVLNYSSSLRMVVSRAFARPDGEQRWLVRYDRNSGSGWTTGAYIEAMVIAVDADQSFASADLSGVWLSSVNAGVVRDSSFYLQLDAAGQVGKGFNRYLNGSPDALWGTFTWLIEAGRALMPSDWAGADNTREWTKLHQSGNALFVMERRYIKGMGYDQWRTARYDKSAP